MEGYAQTAAFMHKNSEVTIFRHFGVLSIQNLLYLQAELGELEYELTQLVEQNKRPGHPNRAHYAKDWWYLSHSEQDGDATQWHKVQEIRTELKEYRQYIISEPIQYRILIYVGFEILDTDHIIQNLAWNSTHFSSSSALLHPMTCRFSKTGSQPCQN